jgi:hypothetical protein
MVSQLDAEMVSVMLLPVGKVALAAPAQQSRRINTSDTERSSKVWMADHLKVKVSAVRCGTIMPAPKTHCNHDESGCRVLVGETISTKIQQCMRTRILTRTTCSASTRLFWHVPRNRQEIGYPGPHAP